MFRTPSVVSLVGLVGVVGLGLGCAQEGGVHVRVILPENSALSPVASKLAKLTLVSETAGAAPQSTTRDVSPGSAAVSFGDLPIAAGVRLSLLGTSAAGRLVGYGRASSPVDVAAGDEVEVPIRLRRPFAYVSGGARLHVFDPTAEAGQPFASTIDPAATPTALATSPDGADIAVVSGTALQLYSTGTHNKTGGPATTLAPGATAMAESPDGRWGVILHATDGMTAGVSVVDLDALRHGGTTATFLEIDHAGAVAVAGNTAFVLVDASKPGPPPAYAEDCSRSSSIVPVTLAGAKAGSTFSLAGAARDLTVSDDGNTLFVAEPCQNAVFSVRQNGASQVKVLTVPGATNVAIAGGRLWTVGQEGPADGVHLVLVSAELDGRAQSRLDLSATQELAESKDISENGQTAEVRLDADRLDAFGLSILPDGRNVAVLVRGLYHAEAVVKQVHIFDLVYDETIVPKLDVDAFEYQLVDVGTGIVTQRLRTSCKIDWEHGKAVLDDWACSTQGSSTEDYVPRQVSVLYGGQ